MLHLLIAPGEGHVLPPHRGPPLAEQPGGDQLAGPRQADPLGGRQDCRQGEPTDPTEF